MLGGSFNGKHGSATPEYSQGLQKVYGAANLKAANAVFELLYKEQDECAEKENGEQITCRFQYAL